ncbi:hypothetical protein ACFYXM_07760 [Streptomyces sp. NPDC002476]|uniref:hypothetical protein n=1 Tax=Streptomyces sp. NPDC002476 TaxID=3364648 RepID=UPI0036CB898F
MRIRKRVAAVLLSAAFVGGTMAIAPTAQANEPNQGAAASCYGSAKSYSKPDGSGYYPAGSATLTTTSNCSDINIKPNTNRYIAVCWVPSSGQVSCQAEYKLATGGQWNVIATNVQTGTRFYFVFRSTALSNGSWAA